jgi:hypothetical protein
LQALLDDETDTTQDTPKKKAAKPSAADKIPKEGKEEADKEPTTTEHISVNKEKYSATKSININEKVFEEIYNKSEAVKDFSYKCIDYVLNNFPNDKQVMYYVQNKFYLQIKVKLEFCHEKLYERTFTRICQKIFLY